jgi:hypothetical protein
MKRPSAKNKRERELDRQLQLVRTTVRVLTPTELGQVNAGTETVAKDIEMGTGCCFWPYTG